MTIEPKDTDAISAAVHRRLFDTHGRQKKKKRKKRRGARLRGRSDKNWGRIRGDGTRADSSKGMQQIATGVVGRFVARSPRKREEKRIGLVSAISGVAHALSPFTWPRPHPITHLMSGQRQQTGNCTRKPDPILPFNGDSGKHSRYRQIMKISHVISAHLFNPFPLSPVCLSKFSR